MLSLLAITVIASLPATAQDTVVRLPRDGTIEISVSARPIVLSTAAGDRVTVAGARVDLRGGRLTIREDRRRPAQPGAITITVPTWATVEMEVVNGSIRLTNPPAVLHATTVDGRIESTGGTGTLELESVAGDVEVRRFRGTTLTATSVSGAITIDGATGRMRLNSINERIAMRDVQGTSVSAESTNGRIDWVGPLLPEGDYRFTTHNGEITLALPSAPSAQFHGELLNGTFSTAIPATHQGLTPSRRDATTLLGRRFTARYGAGQARVTVTTFNGAIRVVAAPPR